MSSNPEWLVFLRAEVERVGRADVLRRLRAASRSNYPSSPTLSQVLGGKYPSHPEQLQSLVEGALMGQTVACPVLGDLNRDVCLKHQKRKAGAGNPVRARLAVACLTCPNRRQS